MVPVLRGGKRERVEFLRLWLGEKCILLDHFIEGVLNQRGCPEVVNSVVSKERTALLRAWKLKIAETVRDKRSHPAHPAPSVISIAFLMCPSNHRNRAFDMDNSVKPVIDGIAMGLWGDIERVRADPNAHFDADDSIFRSIYLDDHRIPNPTDEGVFVSVSVIPTKDSAG